MLIEELEVYKDNKGYNEDNIIAILIDVIDHCCDEEVANKVLKKVHESVYGKHFNEKFADKVVSEFFYINNSDEKVHGPFITKDVAKDYYQMNNKNLTDNNFYDFYVAVNKVYSDHKKLLMKWFNENEVVDKCVELTMSCINDDDYSTKGCKIWNYVNQEYL